MPIPENAILLSGPDSKALFRNPKALEALIKLTLHGLETSATQAVCEINTQLSQTENQGEQSSIDRITTIAIMSVVLRLITYQKLMGENKKYALFHDKDSNQLYMAEVKQQARAKTPSETHPNPFSVETTIAAAFAGD